MCSQGTYIVLDVLKFSGAFIVYCDFIIDHVKSTKKSDNLILILVLLNVQEIKGNLVVCLPYWFAIFGADPYSTSVSCQ